MSYTFGVPRKDYERFGGLSNFVREQSEIHAQAAGLTDYRWSVEELLSFSVPSAEIPEWRGRRPKWLVETACAA